VRGITLSDRPINVSERLLMHTSVNARRGAVAAVSVSALLVGLLGGTGTAQAQQAREPLTPRTHFTMKPDGSSGLTKSGEGIPNIDSDKATIRTYYGASSDGIADKKKSPYISEISKLLTDQSPYLAQAKGPNQAIVLDTDDTTLWTYDMEDGAMHFNFDPVLQNTWVQDQRFPAVPSMPDFVDRAAKLGYTVFGVTGRSDDQEAATLANLTKVGYGTYFTADKFYTKWTGVGTSQQPAYITCATAKCTTVEYKAQTRKYIESLGYNIVLNVGDQWSDLMGGYSDRVLKLPNPTYYLPSPNLPGLSEPTLQPRTRFTMEPDGSSGATEGGEGIPNIDSVKATIRAYYNATDGIAAKHRSRYITEMQALRDKWSSRLKTRCTNQAAMGNRPAVVFDADDTTLWTYDMEDAAMHFNFDPELQDEWVQDARFPAVPGMKRVVRAAKTHGCQVFGLTGRSKDQKKATLRNLREFYDNAFVAKRFFTKWADGHQPAYITCEVEDDCTRVEFKSQTRAHIEKKFDVKIIGNFGDQYSDLLGGHGKPVKLPNPTYYLP
jgi:predicted secreted acid phosphatase